MNFEKCVENLQKGIHLEEVKEYLNSLLSFGEHDHNEDYLIFLLGTCYLKSQDYWMAKLLFRTLFKIKKRNKIYDPDILHNLGTCEREISLVRGDKYLESAKTYYMQALRLRPDAPNTLSNLLTCYVGQGKPDEGLKIYKNGLIGENPDVQALNWNYGLLLLEKGDYEQGWDYYCGVENEKKVGAIRYCRSNGNVLPEWKGQKGQTVIVAGEQGIGDEIMFASILPEIMKDCTVILDCHPRLQDIFRDSFPGITIFGTRKTQVKPWTKYYQIDSYINIRSLAKLFRRKIEDFPKTPYLVANTHLKEDLRRRLDALGTKKKIGLSWKGGTPATGALYRDIPLDTLLPVFNHDFEFISLQYTPEAREKVEEFSKRTGKVIHHWQDVIDDYDKTAALVSNLDLVISVPQSVVHLAGALGTPTWQLCPKRALWQCGVYGHDTPWYGSVRNFWQDGLQDWSRVIKKVEENLCKI